MMHKLHQPVSEVIHRVAREIMMPRFQRLAAEDISDKTPGDPVTIVDRESEALLGEVLGGLIGGSKVIGEEAVSLDPALIDDIGDGIVWIIDPLDGTKNFTEGHAPFAIMIGLLMDGTAEAAWIYDPLINRMVHAVRGAGAFIDGERVTARATGKTLPVSAIAYHFLSPEQRTNIEQRAEGKLEVVPIPRCAGEQYPRLVLGENDIALFERSHPWDHVPGGLFLEEAGGKLARLDGSPYRADVPGRGLIGAASPRLWDEVACILVD